MKNKLKNVKVGQKVYSITYGSGRVKKLFDDVFTAEFGVFHYNLPEQIIRDEFSFKYNGAPEHSWTDNQEIFLKKPVVTTKSRLNRLLKKAFNKGWRSCGKRKSSWNDYSVIGNHDNNVNAIQEPCLYIGDTPILYSPKNDPVGRIEAVISTGTSIPTDTRHLDYRKFIQGIDLNKIDLTKLSNEEAVELNACIEYNERHGLPFQTRGILLDLLRKGGLDV